MKLQKIISGGQTGVDTYALEIATQLGIPTGGTAPRYYLTERGANTELKKYGLVEHSSMLYPPRTEANILNSEATILFGNPESEGAKLAKRLCKKHGRPLFHEPTADHLMLMIEAYKIRTINIAGNRGSKLSQFEQFRIKEKLRDVLYPHRRIHAEVPVNPITGTIPRF